jgi:LAO/AO transport system kinase
MLPATRVLFDGIRCSRRECLARAITLIESSNKSHQQQAALLLDQLAAQRHSSNNMTHKDTLRIGVAGPPGAGKSTFIEQMGLRLINNNHKVAVIPVDPSSHISGGSILGDKTRMEQLSRSMDAYIRASPTRGVLGGIAEHTADVISLCEFAGFNVVIVESVGLGQSEVDIDSAVDILVLLVPPGGGDSLQATKKGIMEAADLVLVNKADGDLLNAAKHTKADYAGAMQFIRRKHQDWDPRVLMMSAHTGFNMDKVEEQLFNYHSLMIGNGHLYNKRNIQAKHWSIGQFRRMLYGELESNQKWPGYNDEVNFKLEQGILTPRAAAAELMKKVKLEIL